MLWIIAKFLMCLCFDLYLIGGQLIDVIRARHAPLPCDKVLQAFYQTCSAVHHMHRQKPPIIHRDLKVLFMHLFHLLMCPSLRGWVLVFKIISTAIS